MRPFPIAPPPNSRIARFLLWASKTDPKLMMSCSRWSFYTQIAYGYFVLFTTLSAFMGAWCAASVSNVPLIFLPVLSAIWAAFVFFLDREITGAFDKRMLWLRPILAVVMSAAVALGIESRLFQGPVDRELQRAALLTNEQPLKEQHAGEARLVSERDRLQRKLEREEQDANQWAGVMDSEAVGRAGTGRTGQAGAGPAYRNAQAQQERALRAMAETRQEIEQFDRSIKSERERLKQDFDRLSIPKTTDFVSRFEALEHVKAQSESLNFLSWLITFMLLVIELTPALMKMMKQASDYDALIAAVMGADIARITGIAEVVKKRVAAEPLSPSFNVDDFFQFSKAGPVGPPPVEEDDENDDDQHDDVDDEDQAA